MALTFPIGCDTPRRRVEYCFRARELLRHLHNKMGYWYRAGFPAEHPDKEPDLTQAQYDANLPSPKYDAIRARYPYAPGLTKEQWDDFQENVYIKIDDCINVGLSNNVQSVMDSSEWTPDLEAIGDL